MEELISKKDLLKQTGISYGQLYRWKRQRLIPESWFMKQSTFTGQETFFPKDRIIKRISMINELKDQYSLEELARLFAPEMSHRTFTLHDLERVFGFVSQLYRLYLEMTEQKVCTFAEVLLIEAIQKVSAEHPIPDEASIHRFLRNVQHWQEQLDGKTSYRLFYCTDGERYYLFLVEQPAEWLVDTGVKVLQAIYLEDLAKEIQIRIQSSLGE